MTDKELKDWCKNCDVEPPAMKFKCPDCKVDEYKKALEEIEEEITALHYITIPFHRGITHELADIVQEYKNKILDIINKAKGEGDAQTN